MIRLIPKLPAYWMFRQFGYPGLYPLNLTVSVTFKCNSRCNTCNVYKRNVYELKLEEFENIFRSIGQAPYWFTMSGGEPFLRKDLVDICRSAYRYCRPGIINIPTNGILSDIIPEQVEQIVQNSPESEIIINISFDEIGEKHDRLRNVKNNFLRARETFERLKTLNYPNLTIGIHSVISRFNVANFSNIYEELIRMGPDSYITEIAEERVELGTIGENITPSEKDYSAAVDFLLDKIKEKSCDGIADITRAFRIQYYELVKRTLREKRQVLPCYAGFLSAHIAPDGDVWACCVKAESMGNLRRTNYDFNKVWFSAKAWQVREPIRNMRCYCPLANAGYTNMLVSCRTMAAVTGDIVKNKLKKYVARTGAFGNVQS